MQRETAKRLHDALAAAEAINRIAASRATEGTEARWIAQLAIERLLITLGEALNQATHTDRTIEDELPDARQIIGMRNRLVHGYDAIRPEIVWDVADRHVPNLVHHLRRLHGTILDPEA